MIRYLESLYDFPGFEQVRDIELQEAAEQCEILEEQIRNKLDEMPPEDRYLMESYMDLRDELEFLHVKAGIRAWKKLHQKQ